VTVLWSYLAECTFRVANILPLSSTCTMFFLLSKSPLCLCLCFVLSGMSDHVFWCLFTRLSRFSSARIEQSLLLFHCARLVHAQKPLRFGSRGCGSHFWAIDTGFSFCSSIVFELWTFKDLEHEECVSPNYCCFYWLEKDHLYVIDHFCNRP